ncbi:formyltetrahydrofolate deformylase [Devosia algicola]|uniref:Formyltetrahydrofolate deformylase n=1 Tax=Devosia algicola TaxID=3026418 RepID=A0ABY7YJ10_9HYPH|nr:formyltetrahydrofolate deformylase [Devosia algicola]WDR01265.1 formyltetrahydrofolate deformylase [Devosia algicola]
MESILEPLSFVLTLSCEDRPGIVASVTTELAARNANIAESNQFWDRQTGQFFMRLAFNAAADTSREALELALKPSVARFGMKTQLVNQASRPRIVVMVSKFDHVLLHLLYQIKVGWLDAEVVGIVSNHAEAGPIAAAENIPFYHWPVSKDSKAEQEALVMDLVQRKNVDLVVLARYMQVLSDTMSTRLFGQIINIHHSFLPSFKGAKPYHQAHDRGVKLIGATAHYVTPALDEGPIIEQETARVSHSMSAEDLVAAGRDIEARVLARAVKLHCENRVMLNGHKTVVFG